MKKTFTILALMLLSMTAWAQETVSVNVTDAGWATLYTDKALDFSGVSGLKAYTATLYDEVFVTLTRVYDVPENTGVVLKAPKGSYSIPVAASSSTDKGDLKGSATEWTPWDKFGEEWEICVLSIDNEGEARFRATDEGSVPPGKAYLMHYVELDARELKVIFADDETTGISDGLTKAEGMNKEIFNLRGQRVAQPTKGLYIVRGKKVVIK